MKDEELAAGRGLSEEPAVACHGSVAAADISTVLAEKGTASTSGLYRRALHHIIIHDDVSSV